jgi:hypothetical protein
LTRVSINLRKEAFPKKMDCRVKPGNDELRPIAERGIAGSPAAL